jgi:hypothetical protein
MAQKKSPRGCANNHAEGVYKRNTRLKSSIKGRGGQRDCFDLSKLPLPPTYYSLYFKLPKQNGQVMVNCCFHDDRTPSLSIDLTGGKFHCFGCDAKGGGVLDFHMNKHSMSFKEACRDLNLEKR